MEAVVIVDGLNLHHALLNFGPEFTRPNIKAIAARLLAKDTRGIEVVYFTSAPQHLGRGAMEDYFAFKSLLINSGVRVVEGRFQKTTTRCRNCGFQAEIYKEKETDVALALEIVESSRRQSIKKLFVFSADSDLAPAITMAKKIHPTLEISIVQTGSFLKRAAYGLVGSADRKIKLSQDFIQQFQFRS